MNAGLSRAVLLAMLSMPLAGPAAEPPCSAPEYRQFDYWLGEWEVFNASGRKIGDNRITREQGLCVLHEHWTDARGGTGESFNMYDRSRGAWHQTWVAATGNLLLLDGNPDVDGNMVLTGTQRMPDGSKVQNRISWVRQSDGAVHQVWEQSTDDGKTWKTAFLGVYRRKAN